MTPASPSKRGRPLSAPRTSRGVKYMAWGRRSPAAVMLKRSSYFQSASGWRDHLYRLRPADRTKPDVYVSEPYQLSGGDCARLEAEERHIVLSEWQALHVPSSTVCVALERTPMTARELADQRRHPGYAPSRYTSSGYPATA